MSKLFIAFLGTGYYITCNYQINEKFTGEIKYIQTGIMKLLCEDFTENDKVLIFCTQKALDCHFDNLKSEFQRNSQITPEAVLIPDGSSEEKLWKIFQIVMDNINDGDEIVFDITHSFRSLPLLMTILLQYLKTVKNISVNGVYYGAFEAIEKDVAPIFDLTPFFSLYDWSIAINNFKQFGRTGRLNQLTYDKLQPILKEAKGSNKNASALNKLMKAVNEFSECVFTCRGKEVQNFRYQNRIKDNIEQLKEELIPPLKPVLDNIEYEFTDYNDGDVLNGFNSVDWCIKHGLIQQGFTILQETTVSYFIMKWELNKIFSDNLKARDFVSSLLAVRGQSKDKSKWKYPLTENISKAEELYNQLDFHMAQQYDRLTQCRNDINHGGYRKAAKSDVLIDKLTDIFNKIKTYLI